MKASAMVQIAADNLETLRRCGGYYECPKSPSGKRLGPLMGYAATYTDEKGKQKQWVGDIYFNFAKAEEFPHVLNWFSAQLGNKLSSLTEEADVFYAAPLGGHSLAQALGEFCDLRVVKVEKKRVAAAMAGSRKRSELFFGRHTIARGDRVIIVEDVCNNFSTTEQIIRLINGSHGRAIGVICLLNRSTFVENFFASEFSSAALPVISLLRIQIPEYRQDDPFVAADVEAGNVVWKPKDNWAWLMSAMKTGF